MAEPATGTTSLLPEFRPIGGGGNNLGDISLNATPGSAMLAIAPLNSNSVDGPNARTLSNILSTAPADDPGIDPTASGMLYVFGQFLDHDISLKKGGKEDISIPVPAGDPSLADGTIIPLTRAAADPKTGTEINTVAANLDLSQVYGSDFLKAASLRNADGTLKVSDGNASPIVDGRFVAGDVRVQENPELVAITTLFVREHNTQVVALKAAHPEWTGDQLYDMARAITTAEYQHVIYSEFLPALIGGAVGPYPGYDPTINPQVTQEFAVAAFRVGHSQVSDEQAGIDNQGGLVFEQTLAESFVNTPVQTVANGIDALLRHLPSDHSQATDLKAVDGLRNLLVSQGNGIDLIATDIARERDAGLGSLNETRVALGLQPYASFEEVSSDPAVVAKLQAAYQDVNTIDLFIGGLAEDHTGGVLGPTFGAIIADQFERLRDADRFFWQNQKFDDQTAATIGQTTLGDVISRNASTPNVQHDVFIAADRHMSDFATDDPTSARLVIGVDDDGALISGGPGDDTIVPGAGLSQILFGGAGADVFQFAQGQSATIADFTLGQDTIQFTVDAADFQIAPTASGDGTVATFGADTVTVAGVAAGSLSVADFLLPPGSQTTLPFNN